MIIFLINSRILKKKYRFNLLDSRPISGSEVPKNYLKPLKMNRSLL